MKIFQSVSQNVHYFWNSSNTVVWPYLFSRILFYAFRLHTVLYNNTKNITTLIFTHNKFHNIHVSKRDKLIWVFFFIIAPRPILWKPSCGLSRARFTVALYLSTYLFTVALYLYLSIGRDDRESQRDAMRERCDRGAAKVFVMFMYDRNNAYLYCALCTRLLYHFLLQLRKLYIMVHMSW